MSSIITASKAHRVACGLEPHYRVKTPSLAFRIPIQLHQDSNNFMQTCVPAEDFSVYNVTFESADEITEQFEDWTLIASLGFIRLAKFHGSEYFILDMASGRVCYDALDEYGVVTAEIGEADLSREAAEELLAEVSFDSFDGLPAFLHTIPFIP